MALPKNLQDREMGKFIEDASGEVALRTALVVKDIQIGAVEIKNHDSDDRVEVNASHELLTKNSALETLVGEVQATPTSNSLLARLKDLLTGIVLAAGDNKIGKVNIIGNTSSDCSGDDKCLITDSSGRLHTRGFRLADGTGARMLVDADRHGQVDVLSMPSVAVTGAFYQVTQPVSIATIPIASTAATSAKQLADGHNVAISSVVKTIETELLAITAITANSQQKSSELDISSIDRATVFIDHARDVAAAFAGNGTEYRIEVSEKATGNDTWRTLYSVVCGIAAASSIVMDAEEAVGQTQIETGATLPSKEDIVFFKNATLANSEWGKVISIDTTGGSEHFDLQDGLTNIQAAITLLTKQSNLF